MEGTKPRQRKDKRWQSNYTKWTPAGPKRASVYGKTYTECLANLHEALAATRGTLNFDSGELTVGEFIRKWLDDSIKGTVREVTYLNYELSFTRHIEPELGRIRLTKLTTPHVLSWLRAKKEAGVGAATMRRALALLKRALAQALHWQLIARNPAEGVKPPRYAPRETRPLSPEELVAFLEAIRGDDYEALFLIAVTGGPREGELLALRWDDVSADCTEVRIDEGVVILPGGVERFNAPKTRSSRRSVPLTGLAAAALREHRKRFLERRLASGGVPPGDWSEALVFPSPRSPEHVYRARNVLRRLDRILERSGLPHVTFHGLRHTFATLMSVTDAHPKDVQGILGHARISQTLDTYTHHVSAHQRAAIQRLDELLGAVSESSSKR